MPDSSDPSVLVVASTSNASGLVTYIAGLAGSLDDLPVSYVVTPGSDLDAALPRTAVRVPAAPSRRGLTAAVPSSGFAAVQTHGARALLAVTAAGVPRRRIHHVFHELPGIQGRRGWLEVALALRVGQAANSPYLAHHLRRYGIRATTVLPPIVLTPDPLPREAARARLRIDPDALAAGVVGRLDECKSPDLAIRAVAQLPADQRDRAIVVFVGDGPSRETLRRLGEELSCAVHLAGPLPDAHELVRAFDIVVAPGRHETFCLSLAEAIVAQVPVAAVRSWGSRTLTDDGRLLRLAQSDPTDLATSILTGLTEAEPARDRLARYIRDRFCDRAGSEAHREFFARVLPSPPQRDQDPVPRAV